MGYDGSLKFDTEISEKGFNSGVKKLGSIAKGGLAVIGGAVSGVAAAMGAGVAAGVKYNASIEQYQTSFEVMTGSAEKAASIVQELTEIGAKTPFEMTGLADTTQLLMNYGFTADDAMDKMMMLGDISQGSADKMNRIAMAYGQMSSAGKVQLEDVKQMIEAGFNPLQEISESTGESMESLYDRISKGTISVDEITASMERATSEGGKYYQSMEKQSQTFNGLISTMKDNAMQLLGEIVEPISEGMTEMLLPSTISALEELTIAFEENGVTGMISAAGNIVMGFVQGISENLPQIIERGLALTDSWVSSILQGLPGALSAGTSIVQTLLLGLVNNAPQIISQALTMIFGWVSTILSMLPSILQSGVSMILSLLDGLIANAPQIITQAATMLIEYAATIGAHLPEILEKGIEIIGNLLAGIIEKVPDLIGAIPGIIADVGAEFLNKDWAEIGWNIIQGIASGVSSAARNLVDAAAAAVDDALNWVKSKLGIASPSKVFRDEVGRYMAEGIGVGFEENMPIEKMEGQLNNAMKALQKTSISATANIPATTNNLIKNVTNNYLGDYSGIDYRAIEKAQERAMNRANERPIYLDTRQIRRAMEDEGWILNGG